MLLIDKTLIKLSSGLWGWIIAIVIVRFTSLIGITYFAKYISEFLGQIFTSSIDLRQLKSVVIMAFLASLLTLVSQLIQGELEYRCNANARINLRKTIFNQVLNLDVGYIETIGPVSAITSSLDAVEQVTIYYSTYIPSLISAVISPIFLFYQLKNISLFTALLLLVVSLSLLPLNNIFRKKIETLRKSYWHSVEDISAYYLDSLKGLTTLKLFKQDKKHEEILSQKANQLNIDINKFMKINFTSFLVTEALIYGAIIICLIHTGMQLKSSLISIGSALTVLLLSYSYFSTIRQLMNATHNALTAVSAAQKLEEILSINTNRPFNRNLKEDSPVFDGIKLSNIHFSYTKEKPILKNINLTIPKGSVVALAGLSGCGKSTLASLIMRFVDADSGDIYIEGKHYNSMPVQELRKKIILVPQSVYLFTGTIRENLYIANEHATDERLYEVLEQVKLKDFVDSLENGLDSFVGDSGSRLSGGQKQKIGIARALLSDAPYIIFDEATSAVDSESEQEIWKCIEELSNTKTLIIISHRLSTIRNSDIIYMLKNGEIFESGNHEKLMENKKLYYELVKEQDSLERMA
mgnify:FL=1